MRPPAKEAEGLCDLNSAGKGGEGDGGVDVSPWSQTPRSHSMQSASARGQEQAWVLRHFLPWQTQASQKSHTAP